MSQIWIDRLTDGEEIAPEQRERLESLAVRERSFQAGQVLLFEDDDAPLLFFVERGWAAAVRELSDGSQQLLDLFLPGQIIGLREVAAAAAVSSYCALTDLQVRVCRKSEMQSLIDELPGLATQVFRVIAREEAWLLERITTLGQRSAAQCITHLMLELGDRLALAAEDVDAGEFDLPLNQEQIGNILGITSVHVSRTLKQLAEDGLLSMDAGRVRIGDRSRCQAFAEYDRGRMRIEPSGA